MTKEELNQKLSDYLKIVRFSRKITQEQLAERLGITRQCYCNWENNPIKITLDQLIQIGNIIGEDILIFFNNYIAKCNIKNS